MTTEMPVTLYTAIGRFKGAQGWNVEVAVPNFSSEDDAKAYAEAFRIRLVDGQLFRDDGKGIGIFDDSWREVLDSQVTLSRTGASDQNSESSDLQIAQWHLEPGLSAEFDPAAWDTVAESI